MGSKLWYAEISNRESEEDFAKNQSQESYPTDAYSECNEFSAEI